MYVNLTNKTICKPISIVFEIYVIIIISNPILAPTKTLLILFFAERWDELKVRPDWRIIKTLVFGSGMSIFLR